MKELAEFTCNAWPILVFVGFVTGLFCTAITLAALSYANRKNCERQEKQFAKCFEFMEAYNESLQEKCNAVVEALKLDEKSLAYPVNRMPHGTGCTCITCKNDFNGFM